MERRSSSAMPVHQDQTLQADTRLHPDLMDQQIMDSIDDEEYICCTLEFDNELDHLSHMITHIAENIITLQRVQCDYCNYSFNNHNGLVKHLPKHRGFNCYYCQQHIPKWWQLVKHVMYEHNHRIKHGNKSRSNNQQNKYKRRATETYNNNKKRFRRKFGKKFLKHVRNENLVTCHVKTEPGNYTQFVSTIKTEPYVKSEPNFSPNVKCEPIFNSCVIKTEPTFDYY